MAGSIIIDLLMRTGAFETDTKRAERRLREFKKEAAQIGRAVGVAFTAAAAGVTAMVVSSVNSAREIQNLSRLANTAAEDFQAFAFGANTVGISQEKLADILKDTSDRVGDFLTTGAGPMADFFETIAPKIGVTAEQFRNLSGRDALLLFVDSLEKANLSQSEMIFFMEAMASDSSALLPLLRGNGEEMRRLGDQAERLGVVLSEVELQQLEDVKIATDELSAAWEGAQNRLVAELIPSINTAAGALRDWSTDGEFARETAEKVATAIKLIASVAIGTAAAVDLVGKGIGGLFATLNAAAQDLRWYEALSPALAIRRVAKNFDDVQNVATVALADLDETAQRYGEVLNNLWNPPDAAGATIRPIDTSRFPSRRQLPTIEVELEPVLPSRSEFDTSWIEALEEGFGRAAGFVDRTRTEVERLEAQIAEVKELAAEGFFAGGRDVEVLERLEEDLEAAKERAAETGREQVDEITAFAEQASRNAQDIIASNLRDGFEDGARGIVDSFTAMISDLVAQALAAQISEKLFGDALGGGGEGGGGLVGRAFGFAAGIFGGGRARGGGVTAGVTYGINELEPEFFTPATSGKVIPLSKMRGAGGGGVSVTQNIQVAGRVDQRTASQLAIEAARRQRVASARLG